jgi:predicted Kef-type K+ transport protein
METYVILTAFAFGFIVKQIGLPPLVGFLTAGFVLNYIGIEATELLYHLSDIGVILLLFSIGLKVQVRKLLEPQIWGTASLHMVITVILLGMVCYGLSLSGLALFTSLNVSTSLLIGFALSFSSTVFAVKLLEESGTMNSKHGRLAIGILIMQDFFAVIFITISSGKIPSPLAFALLGLFFLRKPLMAILDRSGHGELLVLLACILPIAGSSVFEYVGLKPDLGALILGMLLAGHPKTDELAKAMFGFKDLFLVGIFLSVGMTDLPNMSMFLTACFLVILVPAKVLLFYILLTRFQLRARTSLFTSVHLANYSEFGLIVGAIGVSEGWIGGEWLVIIAVALSISMIAASPVVGKATLIYSRWHDFLRKYESKKRLPGDRIIDIGEARVLVLGMGRIGTGAYEQLRQRYGKNVLGLDSDEERANYHQREGRNVKLGDASDYDLWQSGFSNPHQIDLALLTMSYSANLVAAARIKELADVLTVAATVEFEDEIDSLHKAGVDHVFNIYAEAGAGFSDHICSLLDKSNAS